MFTDDDRRVMYDALEASLGARTAALLMAHLPPAGWADLATRADLDGVNAELKGDIAQLRGELRAEIATVSGRIDSMLPRLVAANIASMIGLTGLVLAAQAVV